MKDVCEEEAAGGGREAGRRGRTRDTESKTRTRRGGGEAGKNPGYRIENKDPTQRCGELWKITIEIE